MGTEPCAEAAASRSALDPTIVEALVRPVVPPGGLTPDEEELLSMVAEGKPIKAIAASRGVPPEAADAEVEAVFVKLAEGVSAGSQSALRRLRMLQQAIIDREEQGETLSRLLPSGLAEKLRQEHREIGETERVSAGEVAVTQLRAVHQSNRKQLTGVKCIG